MIRRAACPSRLGGYRDLRRVGTAPHAGLGLGLERLVACVTGMEKVRDIVPFPQVPGSAPFRRLVPELPGSA